MGLRAARPPRVEKLQARGDAPALLRALAYEDESEDRGANVRARAAAALIGFDEPGVSEALVQALGDGDQAVRDAAIAALVERGPSRAVQPMSAAVTLWTSPEHAGARGEALAALEAMHDPDVCARVAETMAAAGGALDERDRDVITKLGRSGAGGAGRAVTRLMGLLGDADRGERAARVLVWLAPESVEPLLAALGDEQKREHAALALGHIHATEAVEALCGLMLESADPGTRKIAAWALGEIRDVSAVEALVLATGDSDYAVRTEAGSAFDRFGNVGMAIALTAMVPQAALGAGSAGDDVTDAEDVVETEEAPPETEDAPPETESDADPGATAVTPTVEDTPTVAHTVVPEPEPEPKPQSESPPADANPNGRPVGSALRRLLQRKS